MKTYVSLTNYVPAPDIDSKPQSRNYPYLGEDPGTELEISFTDLAN